MALGAGQKKVIVSFRATGESHISSLVFRQGLLDENGMIHLEPAGRFFGEGVVAQQDRDNKMVFATLLSQMVLPDDIISHILDQLKDPFSYKEIEVVLKDALLQIESVAERKKIREEI